MKDDNRAKKSKRKTWLFRGVFIVASIVVVLLGAAWWIMIRMPGTSYRGELPVPDDSLRSLGAELRQEVQRLAVDIGERNVRKRPKQLAQAADYIEAQFQGAGYEVKRQEYEASNTKCWNVEVEIRGKTRPEEIVVVGAHYDTAVGTPGANDNASGVAATLALARRFSRFRNDRTVRFVAFVNEEQPYAHTESMGSRVYARRSREQGDNIVAMLCLETLGWYDDRPDSQNYPLPFRLLYPSTGNFIGFVGNLASRDLVRQAIGTFRQAESFPSQGAALPEAVDRVGASDHKSFWRDGYPALMVTDTAFFRYPHYHDPEDTIDKVDFDRMARVVRGLEKVVAELVGGDDAPHRKAIVVMSESGEQNGNPRQPAESGPLSPPLLEDIRTSVSREVKEGFRSEEQIIEGVTEMLEDEHKRSDLRPHIARITSALIQEHRRTQATWATPTDCDKLDKAFANLEQQGIVARQNFACCQNCGHAEIGDEIKKAQKLREVKGYTFYHMQDTESASETGTLYLAYGSLSGKEEDSVAVGHAIVKAIRAEGLTVNWEGTLNKRICVVKMDWKRRRK